jgi:hypothetical protein
MVKNLKFGKVEILMKCAKCSKVLDPARHGDLVFDGQVWCHGCHRYDERLMEKRAFPELESWVQRLCQAFNQEPVHLQRDPDYLPDPRKYYDGATFCLAEAFHKPRGIMLHPPGHQLVTLCHELAHLFTGQDHNEAWARTFARLVAWVKLQL